MSLGRLHYLTHVHRCNDCGRGFYLCTERDCDLAPAVCRACEMDRQDAYLSTLEQTHTQPEPNRRHAHGRF